MTSRLSNIWPLAAALFLGISGCEGLKLDTPDTRTEDAQALDVAADVPSSTDVPTEATDSLGTCTSDDDGSPCEFLDGEVVLKLTAGALGGRMTLTLEKQAIRIDGQDYVGYVWGPHGHPIDPAAEVIVTTDQRAPAGAKLTLGNWNGTDSIVELAELSLADGPDGTTILSGRLDILQTLVIFTQ